MNQELLDLLRSILSQVIAGERVKRVNGELFIGAATNLVA